MREMKVLPLPFGASQRVIYAGSYLNYPGGMYGVKLAPEVKGQAHMIVPIKDFGLPDKADTYSALRTILYQVALGRPVYMGCFGGLGRTGTFLALLYKVLGVKDPVRYVRKVYDSHAVETREQERFVRNFFMIPLKLDVWRARATAFMVDRRSQEAERARLFATVLKSKGLSELAKECE